MNHLMTVVNELDRLSQYFVCSEGASLSEWLERTHPNEHQALLDEVRDHYGSGEMSLPGNEITNIIQTWLTQWSSDTGASLIKLELERLKKHIQENENGN